MILLPLRVVIQSRRSVHLFASHSLTLLTLWYKSMHKHVLYNDRRIVWICFAWQKQNESSTSFSNLGRYFHTCIHTYIRMYVRACICMYLLYLNCRLSYDKCIATSYVYCIWLHFIGTNSWLSMLYRTPVLSKTDVEQTHKKETRATNGWMMMVVQVHIASPSNVNSRDISVIF